MVMSCGYTPGQSPQNTSGLSKENLSRQWHSCLLAWSRTEGKIQRQDQWTWKNDRKVEKTDYTIINNYPCTLTENDTSVAVTGKDYHFILSRNKASDQWKLDRLSANKQMARPHSALQFPSLCAEDTTDNEALSICSQLAVGLQLDQNFIYLPSLWSTDAFVIDEHKVINDEKDTKHYIKFHCTQKSPHTCTWIAAPEDDFDIQGELWFATDFFLISRAEVSFNLKNNPWKLHQTCTYQMNAEGIPLPLDFYCKAELTTHLYEQRKHFEIKTIESIPSSRFTLSCYDLPEPDFSNPYGSNLHRNSLQYVLLTIAAVIIVWTIVARIKKRKSLKKTGEITKQNLWMPVCLGLFIISLLIGSALAACGKLDRTIAWLSGDAVYIYPKQIDLGKQKPDRPLVASFKMHNFTNQSISVAGEQSNCTCTYSDHFPITASPGATVDINVTVSLPVQPQNYDQVVTFWVAEPKRLVMHPVRIVASIQPSNSP